MAIGTNPNTLSVNTLLSSQIAQNGLRQTQPPLLKSLQRLSTGLRINSAADDPAGSMISQRLTARIEGFDQGIRNINDGLSILRTAGGATDTVTYALQRMREIAVQAANASVNDADRAVLQTEMDSLVEEIGSTIDKATFNDAKLLDGTYFKRIFQVGPDSGDTVEVSINGLSTTSLGAIVDLNDYENMTSYIYSLSAFNSFLFGGTASSTPSAASKNANSSNQILSQTLTLNGGLGSANVNISNGNTAEQIASSITGVSGTTGISATASTTVKLSGFTQTGSFSLNLGHNGGTLASINTTVTNTSDLTSVVNAINAAQGTSGVTAAFGDNSSEIVLTQATGKNIVISQLNLDTGNGRAYASIDGTTGNIELGQNPNDSIVVAGRLELTSDENFSVSSSAAQNNNVFGNVGAGVLVTPIQIEDPNPPPAPAPDLQFQSLSDISVLSTFSSSNAIEIIDGALDDVTLSQAGIGAIESRFELISLDAENSSSVLQSARSRITDADFAQEASIVAKGLVLQQAGVAVLAQANSLASLALNLLTTSNG